jgi:hypothetical protein
MWYKALDELGQKVCELLSFYLWTLLWQGSF